MKTDDPFERLLSQQTLRPVPSDWRADILGAAQATRPTEGAGVAGGFWQTVRFLFCPSPRLTGALAAAWSLILGLNYLSLPSTSDAESPATRPPTAVIRMAWLEQQRLRQELLNDEPRTSATSPALRTPPAIRPRSALTSGIQWC